MSEFAFKLPDLGEGTVAAEIVAWRVKPGDLVAEDQPLVEMSTEKAVVEVPSPVAGRVVSLSGEPGDQVAVGAPLVVLETDDDAIRVPDPAAAPPAPVTTESPARSGRVLASPAMRRRAREAGIDLAAVKGSGPGGRIQRSDIDGADAAKATVDGATTAAIEEIKMLGVRRQIAQRMADAKRSIPHFGYVEEVDITLLESLRMHLNGGLPPGQPPLTYLPFIVAALASVLADHPQCNAHYDAERSVISRYRAVHVGIATQTPNGLKVPVVRDAQSRSLWNLAAEIRRVADAARDNTARREELSGSTITVTSLGKLGGIVSTPIINMPELAIIGVNKAVDRPVVLNGTITVRRVMNLSSSFDHRCLDGYDAAAMIQALKNRLEQPATIFIAPWS